MKAFPQLDSACFDPLRDRGMDLRDYFAAHCPQEHIGSVTWGQIIKFKGLPERTRIEEWKDEYTLEWQCAQRYEYADAMMKVREL